MPTDWNLQEYGCRERNDILQYTTPQLMHIFLLRMNNHTLQKCIATLNIRLYHCFLHIFVIYSQKSPVVPGRMLYDNAVDNEYYA